jgi:beta-N-acetylhexosaminidase
MVACGGFHPAALLVNVAPFDLSPGFPLLMMHRFVRCLFIALLALGPVLAPASRLAAQGPTPVPLSFGDEVNALIAGMSVPQRIGQLFVVGFPGANVAPDSDIADLIINYHIGGVQLRATNGNFDNVQTEPPPPQQIAQLANALQTLAFTRPAAGPDAQASPTALTESPEAVPPATVTPAPTATPVPALPVIPLFIALSADAETRPRAELSEVTQDVTQLPSQMAVGATWKPDNARISGEIFGREYAQMGINVLFGPMLDVVDVPKPNTPGDLGNSVFGGDPFWVGQMGAAFVAGVHRGSEKRIAVIAKNFPGLGSSDRDVRDEIPTVQKSLEQLKQIELAPFFAVTRGSVEAENTVDGLMVSHIRYRGFQGNIRASTRPVSLDPQAYQALMTLPETQAWRDSGGITFSDSLGARSVRRFYDPLESSFNARRIAQEAFVAGNDVLVLDSFGLTRDWPEQLANIKEALRFFQTRYVEDPNFAQRVDASLQRILALKFRLNNGSFNRANILVDDAVAGQMPLQTSAVINIAKQAITLLSPNPRDLQAVLPNAPTKDDSIVFITDDRQLRDCPQCETYPAVPQTALEEIALNLYGPRTTGQVDPAQVSSFTFSDLIDYNTQASAAITATPADNSETPTAEAPVATPAEGAAAPVETLRIQSAIERSTWIVIAMIDTNPLISPTQALRTFLSQSADTLKDKRVIVFALGAPYYLDATEISKITAYFGVYSRSPAFLEAALRALFGEYVPTGKSPISVPALNYSLINVTAPDPAQVIPLTTGDTVSDTQATPEPLTLNTGERLRLRAGPILDLNGNLVPDGTQVQFILSYPAERVEQRQSEVSTQGGIAETTIALEREGRLEIRAEADPALTSYVVRVDTGSTTQIETIRPTAAPTETPAPAATAVERATAAPTPVPTPAASGADLQDRASITGFLLTFIGLLMIGFSVFAVLAREAIIGMGVNARLRIAIGVWVLGWLIYGMAAQGLPGTRWVTNMLGWAGSAVFAIILTLAAAAVLFGLLRTWHKRRDKNTSASSSQESRS